jgi:hypothetical protein
MVAYLAFDGTTFLLITISTDLATYNAAIASLDASSLSEVLLSLLFPDLDLLFLATTAQLVGLELVLGLELRSPMFWDVAISHG